jgi:cytochrome P450
MGSKDAGIQRLMKLDPRALEDPYAVFAELRESEPVHFSEAMGAWVLTRYDDVRDVLLDTARFSSRSSPGPPSPELAATVLALAKEEPQIGEWAASLHSLNELGVLITADPPEHGRQRRLVNLVFRRSRLHAMAPLLERVVDGLIDGFAERGRVEFVSEFAIGLPMTIIAHALGVEDGDLDRFKWWSDSILLPVGNRSLSPAEVRRNLEASVEFNEYFAVKLEDRRKVPRNDLLSDVANAELDAERLTEAEQLGMLSQFLLAGNETTTKVVTNIARNLAEHPDVQRRVREDRSLVEPVIEESLRLNAPVLGLYRQATRDVELGGEKIAAGDFVWVLYAAANRDPSHFPEPDRFDPSRPNAAEHFTFGHGEHYCIGSGLARVELDVAVNRILDRIEDIAIDEERNRFEHMRSYILNGLTELHLRFRPRA